MRSKRYPPLDRRALIYVLLTAMLCGAAIVAAALLWT